MTKAGERLIRAAKEMQSIANAGKPTELRSEPLGIRVTPSVKAALKAAADADQRSMARMAERLIVEGLVRAGFMEE